MVRVILFAHDGVDGRCVPFCSDMIDVDGSVEERDFLPTEAKDIPTLTARGGLRAVVPLAREFRPGQACPNTMSA